jgi:hypothetical protein
MCSLGFDVCLFLKIFTRNAGSVFLNTLWIIISVFLGSLSLRTLFPSFSSPSYYKCYVYVFLQTFGDGNGTGYCQ